MTFAEIDRRLRVDTRRTREIEIGLQTQTYGPYLRKMMDFGLRLLESGRTDALVLSEALAVAGSLFARSEELYRANPHALVGRALEDHQRNVLRGENKLVPTEARMSRLGGVAQVVSADAALNACSHAARKLIAALNYGAVFNKKTMADASLTQQRLEDLGTLAKRTSHEGMMHLTVTNAAIGQIVAGVYAMCGQSRNPLPLRVFDLGTGYGATAAAFVAYARRTRLESRPPLAFNAIDITPELLDQFVAFATPSVDIANLGLRVTESRNVRDGLAEYGELRAIYGDVADVMSQITTASQTGLTVVIANYSVHRIPSVVKNELLLARLVELPNVIIAIGDLMQNVSELNLGMFDIAANGPLNAGNRGFERALVDNGFDVVDLYSEAPASLDPRLLTRIQEGPFDDGHLWIAHSGALAREVLDIRDFDLAQSLGLT